MNIGVFASGGGSNFQSLMDRVNDGSLSSRITLLISNNSNSGAMERARAAGIASVHISGKTHPDPDSYEQAVLAALRQHEVDLICLAGYMKLMPARVISAYEGRIINIHPGLLPKFGGKGMYGARVHEAVLAAGETESGPTVHYVDGSYDTGAIIRQSRVPVFPGDTPDTLAARVLEAEHDLYWRVVKMFEEQAGQHGQ